jgi:hypothetical protein
MSPEPVGSLAEEAAKLVSALSSLSSAPTSADEDADPGSQQTGERDSESDDGAQHDCGHHDPTAAECRYCPLCALARAARSMTPEVREHLASAAGSLLLAVRGLVEEAVAKAEPTGERVEKIDLAED